MANKLKITWTKSGIGTQSRHRRTIKALGLRRLNHSVIKVDNPAVRGMIDSVSYMVRVEEVLSS